MKVLQLPFTYYPDAVGGTEIYVEALAQRLRAHGVESVIASPTPQDGMMEREGLRLRFYWEALRRQTAVAVPSWRGAAFLGDPSRTNALRGRKRCFRRLAATE